MKIVVNKMASNKIMEATNAKYLLDYLYYTRDDEQFKFYKKVSEWFVILKLGWWAGDIGY